MSSTSELPVTGLTSHMELQKLTKLANAGDADALTQLCRVLDANPQVWQEIGDLAKHAQFSIVKAICNGNQLIAESVKRKADELRRDLSGENPSPLEKLAIERVVATFLEMQFVDIKHPADSGQNLPTARYVVQLKVGVQKRFDSALKSLLLIRERQPGIERGNWELAKHKRRIIRLQERTSA